MLTEEKNKMIERIDRALDDIRPHLAVDGGNVEVMDVSDDFHVKIKWLGNCESCAMSVMTLRAGIEETLKNKIPEITGVEAINGYVA
ncbi:MAG: NifU family protein [Bacteroidota bacterium]